MKDRVYRSVNKYIDFSTDKELLVYTKTYDEPGKAKAQATRMRKVHPWIGKEYKRHLPHRYGHGRDMYDEVYEYVETWCEVASEWERV